MIAIIAHPFDRWQACIPQNPTEMMTVWHPDDVLQKSQLLAARRAQVSYQLC